MLRIEWIVGKLVTQYIKSLCPCLHCLSLPPPHHTHTNYISPTINNL